MSLLHLSKDTQRPAGVIVRPNEKRSIPTRGVQLWPLLIARDFKVITRKIQSIFAHTHTQRAALSRIIVGIWRGISKIGRNSAACDVVNSGGISLVRR